jgi:hypothetical protein
MSYQTKLSLPAGDYEGDLLDDSSRHGNGIMRFQNGNSYTGEWREDHFEGTGKYVWADGRTYEGRFTRDKMQGRGLAYWPDGRVYIGEWMGDVRDGHGIFSLADKRVFEGVFRKDFPGVGQMIETNGEAHLAIFDGSTHASEWRPCQKNKVGVFKDGWSTAEPPHWIREFAWEDGQCYAGTCVGYCPLTGVHLDTNGSLSFVVYDGTKTFADGPFAVSKRQLNWQVPHTLVDFPRRNWNHALSYQLTNPRRCLTRAPAAARAQAA